MSGAILIIRSDGRCYGLGSGDRTDTTIICNFMLSLTDNGLIAMLLIQVFLLMVGMFMDASPAVFNSGAGVPANHAGIRL